MLKNILILSLILLSGFLFGNTFEVLDQSEDGLTVKFTLPEYNIEKVETDGKVRNKITCIGSELSAEDYKPSLPTFSECIGLPVDGNFNISIIDKKQKTVPTIPIIQIQDSFYERSNYSNKNKTSSKLYPESIIKKGDSAYLGNRYFAGFSVFPFQYVYSQKKLLITTEITFRILLSGDKKQKSTPSLSRSYIDDDNVSDKFFLNNSTSKHWRKEKEVTSHYIATTRSGDLVNEVKFAVDEDGIYKITFDELIEALSDPDYPIEYEMEFDWDSIDPRFLELSDENGPVPIYLFGESDGSFDEGDYIEFYGTRHAGETSYYDDYTSENVYFLSLLEQPGSRMAVEDGGLVNYGQSEITIPTSFKQTIHVEEQNSIDHLGAQYVYNSQNFFREDIWFWSKINGPGIEIIPFDLQYPHETNIRRFTANVCLFSSTYDIHAYYQINHYAQVNINTALIDQKEWYGQTEVLFSNGDNPNVNSDLEHGVNNLFVSLPGLPNIENEQVLLDYFELTYWREYKTDDDFLEFTKPQNEPLGSFQFELQNFSTEDISIYKIGTSVIENYQVSSFFETGGAPFNITFQDSIISEATEYVALSEDMKKFPKYILPNHPSSLKSTTNFAEYIIITTQEFSRSESTLQYKELWENQNFDVKIVAVEDIFDEFNNGIRSAESIKEFLQYAYNNWAEPQLTHVLLLGDGLTDERDNSPDRKFNLIPFRNVWADRRGAIASDNWLACIVGDDPVADVSIGRVSVWEDSQIEDMLNKTAHYIENPNYEDTWHSRVTFAAGGNPDDGSLFANQSENIKANWIPDDFYTSRVYCNVTDLPGEYFGNTTTLISNINDGSIYVQFMGHGGGYVWADYNLLNKANISTMNNENYPLVGSLSCYGSAFNYAQSSCIGEELILAADKGAIGHIGFTGYGYENGDETFGNHLNEAIFDLNIGTIGDIVNFTKAKFYTSPDPNYVKTALIHGCALLGDPMISLFPTNEKRQIALEQYNLSPEDTLRVSSFVGNDITHGKFVIFDDNDVQLSILEYFPFSLPAINGELSIQDYIIPSAPSGSNPIYSKDIKLFGYGPDKEITGIARFTVGQSAVANISITPETPTQYDPIMISAEFFDEDGIDHVNFEIIHENYTVAMVSSETNYYELPETIPAHSAGDSIKYRFIIFDDIGNQTETETRKLNIAGPDLLLDNVEIVEYQDGLAIKAHIKNIGSTESGSCLLKVYDSDNLNLILAQTQIEPLAIMQSRFEYVSLPILNKEIVFKVIVNENEESFSETGSSQSNNRKHTELISLNLFRAGLNAISIQSSDTNLICEFPANLLLEEAIFYLNKYDFKTPLNQPDNDTVLLARDNSSICYEIDTYSTSLLADTLGFFPNNNKVILKFNYHPSDSLTQAQTNQGNLYVYRWEEDYQKWIIMGGTINQEEKYVTHDIERTGIYTILQNNDVTIPFVEANIEDQEFTQGSSTQGQEFTHGGYISRNGTISFILNDANGIDIFNHDIALYLSDGSTPINISENDYSITLSEGNLTQIPLKYQLDNLSKGTYYLTLDCYDVNANFQTVGIEFDVSTKFDILNFANYPNPVKTKTINPVNEGRTRFTYVLTDEADKVTLKIYTVSGRLVKTFIDLPTSVGYHEYPRTVEGWDCRNKDGFFLANGVYFYRIIAKRGGKTVEKTEKMAIIK
jgi:Peptidase family C25/Propeptide_C25